MKVLVLLMMLVGVADSSSTQAFPVQDYYCHDIAQCVIPVNGSAGIFVGGSLNEAQNALGSWSNLTVFDYQSFSPETYNCNPNTSWTITNLGGMISLVQAACNGVSSDGAPFTIRYVILAAYILGNYVQPWHILSGMVTLTE